MSKRVLIPYRHHHKLKPYVDSARAAGADVVTADVNEPLQLTGFDGLLLMGGTDVNPARYEAVRWPETEEPDDGRDGVELDLIDQAIARDLPIFAICRGLQILNVYHGGTLWQHLSDTNRHDVDSDNKGAPAHAVLIEQACLLGSIAGVPRWEVNSRHHQAANKIGQGLQVTARDAEDRTVEGLERSDRRWVVAVQWHPEDQYASSSEQRKLFEAFVQAL